MRTHFEASAAENLDYKDALVRGEIGIQRPGRVNEIGIDSITARRNSSGQMEIVLKDTSIDPAKRLEEVPASWIHEAREAIEGTSEGATRLRLHNEAIESEIRDALAKNRIVVEVTVVEVGPDAVRFTLLSSAPVTPRVP